MRGIFFGTPLLGHMNMSFPLINALIERGEQISVYISQDFKSPVKQAGAEYYPSPFDQQGFLRQDASRNIPPMFSSQAGAAILEETWALLPEVLEMIKRNSYDYIICDTFCLWGRVISKIVQLPVIMTFPIFSFRQNMMNPINMINSYAFPNLFKEIASLIKWEKIAGQIAKKYKINRFRLFEFLLDVRGDLNLIFTSKLFHPYSERFDNTYKFIGPLVRDKEYSVDSAFLNQLDKKKPVLYISVGTIFNYLPEFYQKCIRAFQNSEFTVILSVGKKVDFSIFSKVPKNIIVREYVPQLHVLEKADIFITHAGINSVTEAICYETPMIVFPQGVDQFWVAKEVEKNRLGKILKKRRFKADYLRTFTEQTYKNADKFSGGLKLIKESFKQCGGTKQGADEIIRFCRGK